jgi:hypothetical protein
LQLRAAPEHIAAAASTGVAGGASDMLVAMLRGAARCAGGCAALGKRGGWRLSLLPRCLQARATGASSPRQSGRSG